MLKIKLKTFIIVNYKDANQSSKGYQKPKSVLSFSSF